MTVENNMLLSSLMASPELSAETLPPAQLEPGMDMESKGGLPLAAGQSADKSSEFWTLLNQTLTDITAQSDPQAIENKDLLAMFNELEVEFEQAEEASSTPSKWLQIMKSHFTEHDVAEAQTVSELELELEPEIAIPSTPVIDAKPAVKATLPELDLEADLPITVASEVEQLPPDDAVSAAIIPAEMDTKTVITGEVLPLKRQFSSDQNKIEGLPQAQNKIETTALVQNGKDVLPLDQGNAAVSDEAEIAERPVFTDKAIFSPVKRDEVANKAQVDIENLKVEAGVKEDKADKAVLQSRVADQTFIKQAQPEPQSASFKEAMNVLQSSANQNQQNPVNQPQFNAINAAAIQPGSITTPLQTASLNPAALPQSLQTLSLAPQAGQAEWGNAIGERVSLLINQKLNHAEIRIDPPHLGKLDIQIQVKEDSAVVMINTQHAQTRDMIDSASARLRDFLQDAGYESVDVNVSHQEQSMADRGDSDSQNNEMSDFGSEEQQGNAGSADRQQATMILGAQDGRIDYFA